MTFVPPGEGKPTGTPGDTLDAAQALVEHLASKMNIVTPGSIGLLMNPGTASQVTAAAHVASALALTDIAASLRILAGRES